MNTGDKALVASITDGLKQSVPDAELTVVSGNPYYSKRLFDVNSVKTQCLFQAVKNTDLFLVAGGEIVRDSSCLLYSPSVLSGPLLAKTMCKPLSCYAVEIADVNEISGFGRVLSKFALKQSVLTTVRNAESKSALEKLGLSKTSIHVTADPAFALCRAPIERSQEILATEGITLDERPLIGIMPRRVFPQDFNLLPINMRLRFNMLSMDICDNLQRSFAHAADYLVEKIDAKIAFFPMYIGSKFGYGDHDFSLMILQSMRHKDRVKIITGDYTAQEILGVFSLMDLVVCTPLHSVILASTAGVPVVTVSYSLKTDRIVKLLGQENLSISAKNVSAEALISRIMHTWANRDKISFAVQKKAELLRKKAMIDVKLTSNLIGQLSDDN
jgi:polysaccharide pyruvyl transferase WcaK-like protein